MDVQIELKDPLAPFGEVVGGSIVLCGPLLPYDEVDRQSITSYKDASGLYTDAWYSEAQKTIWCMLLHISESDSGYGLLLKRGKGIDGNCFERVGFFELSRKLSGNGDYLVPKEQYLKHFQDFKHSTITII
jgi:hypothetical protein